MPTLAELIVRHDSAVARTHDAQVAYRAAREESDALLQKIADVLRRTGPVDCGGYEMSSEGGVISETFPAERGLPRASEIEVADD